MADVINSDFLKQLAPRVEAICLQAGEAILAVYHGAQGFDVETKADHSPVTDADFAAHNLLAPGLAALLPETPVLSEESDIPAYAVRRQWRRYWLVDPLDGTKEFIGGSGEFTVNVALIEDGCPILGVVYVPVTGVTYIGGRGLPARKVAASKVVASQRESGPAQAIASRSLSSGERPEPIIIAVSRRHRSAGFDATVARLGEALGPLETKLVGSSLKFCMVAEGSADLYPRFGPTSEWDTAAAQAIVEAAGGAVVDSDFKPLRYNTKDDLLNSSFFVLGDPVFDWPSLLVPEAKL